MDWQPEETAPKDGSLILVVSPSGWVEPAKWCAASECWSYGEGYGMYEIAGWLPIPPRPLRRTA